MKSLYAVARVLINLTHRDRNNLLNVFRRLLALHVVEYRPILLVTNTMWVLQVQKILIALAMIGIAASSDPALSTGLGVLVPVQHGDEIETKPSLGRHVEHTSAALTHDRRRLPIPPQILSRDQTTGRLPVDLGSVHR
jgi:hypothetical protein